MSTQRDDLIREWREEAEYARERDNYILNRCAAELELRAATAEDIAKEWLAEATTYRVKAVRGEAIEDNLALADALTFRAYQVLLTGRALIS